MSVDDLAITNIAGTLSTKKVFYRTKNIVLWGSRPDLITFIRVTPWETTNTEGVSTTLVNPLDVSITPFRVFTNRSIVVGIWPRLRRMLSTTHWTFTT